MKGRKYYWRISEIRFVGGEWERYRVLESSEDRDALPEIDPKNLDRVREDGWEALKAYSDKENPIPGHYKLEIYWQDPDGTFDNYGCDWVVHNPTPNTKECAYDAFGNELHVGDKVAFAASRWTGDYIIFKGEVVGWTEKMVKVKAFIGAINSDKPAGLEYQTIIGRVTPRKPDKLCKIFE